MIKILVALCYLLPSACLWSKGDKNKQFGHADFESSFKIRHLKHPDIVPEIKKILDRSNVDNDPEYRENKAYYDAFAKKYSTRISQGYTAPLIIKWVNDTCGFGVFAKKNIKKDAMVGEYTGILRNYSIKPDSKYAFAYPTIQIGEIKYDDLVVDANEAGNITRFINHSIEHKNVEHTIVYDNKGRHIVFYASRNIKAGEQLFIDYGEEYWDYFGIKPQDWCLYE